MGKGRPERMYIAISDNQTFILPLTEMAAKFDCSKESIILNSVRGNKKKAFGQFWYFDLAFDESCIEGIGDKN